MPAYVDNYSTALLGRTIKLPEGSTVKVDRFDNDETGKSEYRITVTVSESVTIEADHRRDDMDHIQKQIRDQAKKLIAELKR